MSERKRDKLDALEKHLKKKLRKWKLARGQDGLTGNYYFRFKDEKRRLRAEFREIVIEGESSDSIVQRLKTTWPPSGKEDVAIRVYSDTIEQVPWDPTFGK
jgi:hypothetical protein